MEEPISFGNKIEMSQYLGENATQLLSYPSVKYGLNIKPSVDDRLTLTWPMCQIWHILFLQILNAPADCMVKQTL